MNHLSLYRRIISGRAGVWASPARGLLAVLEVLYKWAVRLRNRRYDREGAAAVLPVPVISVGNITVGGTGKTPFVIEVVKHLEKMGRSPAVVARGYGADRGGSNDEERLIKKSCPGVAYVADADRARAAEIAWRRCGADVIVLDDGFQHRRLGRKLDIVLIDATCPFGYNHLLPRGLLREPVDGLWRANLVAVTRADQAAAGELYEIDRRVRRIAHEAEHIQCNHCVTSVERLDGTAIGGPFDGKRAVVFAGVGNPTAFCMTVRSLGFKIVGTKCWPDHHRYRRCDIDGLLKGGRFPPHDLLLTTEKDAVKLAGLGGLEHANIGVVRIAIDFANEGGTILRHAIERLLQQGDAQ